MKFLLYQKQIKINIVSYNKMHNNDQVEVCKSYLNESSFFWLPTTFSTQNLKMHFGKEKIKLANNDLEELNHPYLVGLHTKQALCEPCIAYLIANS